MIAPGRSRRIVLHCLRALGVFWLVRRLTCRRLRILCYHGFSIGDQHEFSPILFMRQQTFRTRMALLRRKRYRVVSISHALALLRSNAVRGGEVVITIDDGWKSTLTLGVPVLVQYGLPSCLYVTTYYSQRTADVFNVVIRYMLWKTRLKSIAVVGVHPALDGVYNLQADIEPIAQRLIGTAEAQLDWQQRQALLPALCRAFGLDPDEVLANQRFSLIGESEIARCRHFGVDVQLHTHRHRLPTPSLFDMAPEVTENQSALEQAKGARCTHFCYPSGLYTSDHVGWLESLGIESATTCDAGLNGPADSPLLLKRYLDRDDTANIEFEAELSGVMEVARQVRSYLQRTGMLSRTQSVPHPADVG